MARYLNRRGDRTGSIHSESSAILHVRKGATILLPIRDYEHGQLACDILGKNTDSHIASIHLFHSVEDKLAGARLMLALEISRLADEQKDAKHEAKQYLKRLANSLEEVFLDAGIFTRVVVSESVADAILSASDQILPDLILLVIHPERQRHWFVPSVTNRVLSKARCPVQIIKPGQDTNWLSNPISVT